jgi:hypothetical protein
MHIQRGSNHRRPDTSTGKPQVNLPVLYVLVPVRSPKTCEVSWSTPFSCSFLCNCEGNISAPWRKLIGLYHRWRIVTWVITHALFLRYEFRHSYLFRKVRFQITSTVDPALLNYVRACHSDMMPFILMLRTKEEKAVNEKIFSLFSGLDSLPKSVQPVTEHWIIFCHSQWIKWSFQYTPGFLTLKKRSI